MEKFFTETWNCTSHTYSGGSSSLPHHGFQGNVCSSTWNTSSPSFFTGLGVCRVLLSYILTVSFWLPLCRLFSPSYMCYPRVPAIVTDGLSLGRQQVHLVWHWLCQTGGNILVTPEAPPLLKWPWKPNSGLLITSSRSSSLKAMEPKLKSKHFNSNF